MSNKVVIPPIKIQVSGLAWSKFDQARATPHKIRTILIAWLSRPIRAACQRWSWAMPNYNTPGKANQPPPKCKGSGSETQSFCGDALVIDTHLNLKPPVMNSLVLTPTNSALFLSGRPAVPPHLQIADVFLRKQNGRIQLF
jgi:hypothetical protein